MENRIANIIKQLLSGNYRREVMNIASKLPMADNKAGTSWELNLEELALVVLMSRVRRRYMKILRDIHNDPSVKSATTLKKLDREKEEFKDVLCYVYEELCGKLKAKAGMPDEGTVRIVRTKENNLAVEKTPNRDNSSLTPFPFNFNTYHICLYSLNNCINKVEELVSTLAH